MFVYLNGEFLTEDAAGISASDRGFLYGDGVFETLRAYDGVVFEFSRHLQRLFGGLRKLRITPHFTERDIYTAVQEILKTNRLRNAYLRVTVSRGVCARGPTPEDCGTPTLLISATEFNGLSEEVYKTGVDVVVSGRKNWRMPEDFDVKSLSFLPNILARFDIPEGSFEALMLNHEGFITECTVSNIFFIKDERLFTPSISTGILKGITRDVVIEEAERMGIPVEEGTYRLEDLMNADEVFITNTLIEVLPVRKIQNRIYGTGAVTATIQRRYKERVRNNTQVGSLK